MPADPTDPDPRLIDAIAQAIRIHNPVGAAQTAEVAARVVAGRPDQPEHTTPVGKVRHVYYRRDTATGTDETVIEVHVPGYCKQAFNDPALWGRRVTVYATDPHTPNQGDTP